MTGGIAGMPNTRYRKGKLYAADMAAYSRQMAADNSKAVWLASAERI